MSYSIAQIKKIKQAGEAAVARTLDRTFNENDELSFNMLIVRAKEREQILLNKLDPILKSQFTNKAGAIDLNGMIEFIDNQYGTKELLVGGEIENYIRRQGYILEAKGSKNEKKKSEEEKNESLITILSASQQQELAKWMSEIIKNKIADNVMVQIQKGSNFISKIKGNLDGTLSSQGTFIGEINNFFTQIIRTFFDINNLSLNNYDLGTLQIKVNTAGVILNKRTLNDKGWVSFEPSTFSISSEGAFFDHMEPMAQQLLYGFMQENTGNKGYLAKFVNDFNKSENKGYLQDMKEEDERKLIGEALSATCSAIMPTFNSLSPKDIAFSGAKANLRGFLGELRTLFILKTIFPGEKGKISPNGLSKVNIGTSGEKESPIDTIIELFGLNDTFGAQTKNLSSNTQDWSGTMTMPSFYSQRLNETLSGDEDIFFNAYSYNQPILNANPKYTKEWNGLVNNPDFIAKFKALSYKIIRQEIKDINMVSYVNDFFFMNNYIVPSSIILQEMQNELVGYLTNSKAKNPYINSSFSYTASNNLVWVDSPDNFDENGHAIFAAGSSNNVSITYSVKLYIQQLANLTISSYSP